jgi:NAD(P)-dependent dehydrogenase (short-subunit alcohol dehydrogenase family)
MSFNRIEELTGQVAVITGGVGGMGYATAKKLAAKGARIVGIVRRDLADAQLKYDQLPNSHLNHFVINASIDDSVALARAVQEVETRAGRCDILVNTAGMTKAIPHSNLDQLTDELFDEILKVNVRSLFATIRLFTPLLRLSGNGLVVNISSASGIRTGGSNIGYAASKAAVDSLTRNLAKTLAPAIRVVSIAPSAVDTNFLPNRTPEFLDKVAKMTPLGRIGEVDDIANTVEALATIMRFTTGDCFVIDGGRTL